MPDKPRDIYDLYKYAKVPPAFGFFADPIAQRQVAGGLTNALSRGALGVFGAPVDTLTMMARPFGYSVPDDRVVGSSEWMGRKLENAGMLSKNRNALAELLTGFVSPDPMDAMKLSSAMIPVVGKAIDAGSATKAAAKVPDSVGYQSWDVVDKNHDFFDGEDYALIEKIFVKPEFRRQGHARKLLNEAIQEIRSEHPNIPIRLAADPQNDPRFEKIDVDDLVSFYEKNGFSVVDSAENLPFVLMEYKK